MFNDKLVLRYQQVNSNIDNHCKDVGIKASKLIVVSKKQPLDKIEVLLKLGHKCFGESRQQEAQQKWSELTSRYKGVELHFIGPLQTNKVSQIVSLFHYIHSVDRPKLIDHISHQQQLQNRSVKLFIQVNTGQETQKRGVDPNDLGSLLDYCKLFPGISVEGLMCIPPINELAAPHFKLLSDLGKKYQLQGLSMGMSNDYREAATLGASHIRVGSCIFEDT